MTEEQLEELLDEHLHAVEENDGEAEEQARDCIVEEFLTNCLDPRSGRAQLRAQAEKIRVRFFS